jgi:hypothetical protein
LAIAIAQSRTEPASWVERARILLAYREDPSFFAVGRRLGLHHREPLRKIAADPDACHQCGDILAADAYVCIMVWMPPLSGSTACKYVATMTRPLEADSNLASCDLRCTGSFAGHSRSWDKKGVCPLRATYTEDPE